MRFSLYVAALIVADAILRANAYYHETEMFWLHVAGTLFLVMDLGDWSRSTWDWIASKNWRLCNGRRSARSATRNWRANRRYELTYRGANGAQRSGS